MMMSVGGEGFCSSDPKNKHMECGSHPYRDLGLGAFDASKGGALGVMGMDAKS